MKTQFKTFNFTLLKSHSNFIKLYESIARHTRFIFEILAHYFLISKLSNLSISDDDGVWSESSLAHLRRKAFEHSRTTAFRC